MGIINVLRLQASSTAGLQSTLELKMFNLKSIDDKILDLNRQITDLEQQKAKLLKQESWEVLAFDLHNLMCHWNHTDGCGFYYADGWEDNSRKPYKVAAQKILNLLNNNLELASNVLNIIRKRNELA